MPGLLDYVKDYQHGGSVDFDPYADTSQADMLTKLGIDITDPEAYGLLPTYDPMGADMARADYDLRGQSFELQRDALGLKKEGLADTLATARRTGAGNLLNLTQQGQQQQAGSLFAGHGAISRGMANVRSDIISGFGDVSADIGRQREGIAGQLSGIGIDESQSYLDLQRDIWRMQQGYESDLLGALGDSPEGSWSFGSTHDEYTAPPADPCAGQCGNHSPGSPEYNTCMQMCEEGAHGGGNTGADGCADGFVWNGSECVSQVQYGDGNCPPGFYWDDALSKCQYGSGSNIDRP